MIRICGSIGAAGGGNSALRGWFLCSPGCHDPWKAGAMAAMATLDMNSKDPWRCWKVGIFTYFYGKFETLCRAGWSFQVVFIIFYHHHEGYLGDESQCWLPPWLPGWLCLRQRKVLLSVASSFGAQLVGLLGADAFATWQVGRRVSNPMTGICFNIIHLESMHCVLCIMYIYT